MPFFLSIVHPFLLFRLLFLSSFRIDDLLSFLFFFPCPLVAVAMARHAKLSPSASCMTEPYVKVARALTEYYRRALSNILSLTILYTADIKPSVMIVEEAAEILEAQLVAVIPPSVQHLIMIGDHKQLRPVVHFHRLKKHHNLDLSLFERLINCKLPYIQLGFQCRMRDEIVDLLRELKIYDNLQTQHEVTI